MLKLVFVSLVIACPQLFFGARVKVDSVMEATQSAANAVSRANATTKWDVLLCDSMCMQCPGGRNVLISRQKGTLHAALSLTMGALTYGLGIPVVNQLAGCSAIGFEFWKDRQEELYQPLRTTKSFGFFFPRGGLETLEHEVKITPEDRDALEYCKRLSDPFLWQAFRGASTGLSAFEQQQEFARRCLSHSHLCGMDSQWEPEGMDNSPLNVARINPFADVSMCSKPKDGEVASKATTHRTKATSQSKATSAVSTGSVPQLDLSKLKDKDQLVDDTHTTLTFPDEEESLTYDDMKVPTANAGNGNGDGTNTDGAGNGGTHDTGSIDDGDAEEDLTVPEEKEILSDADLSANTVEAAGHLINQLAHGGESSDESSGEKDGEFFGMTKSDDVIVKVAYGLCHFDKQQQNRCSKLNLDKYMCRDRCCLDVCRFYSSKPSCVHKCVGGVARINSFS